MGFWPSNNGAKNRVFVKPGGDWVRSVHAFHPAMHNSLRMIKRWKMQKHTTSVGNVESAAPRHDRVLPIHLLAQR